ncbi:tRNA 1-methyladenosine methyltransferase subunit GCD10 [Aspergillus ruber CBS 135680]|uniref:tRNA (adenine(58)-N(1))-methyltransferase non-catalytic subunit TRM6 n=1 Tax=Aspergillus ruber (strain CBS 135680) TaxID=1388766 RepID=A0A017S1M3_ASPRC|nr:eukaryotic translation initiation factor 3, gamma subunit [Aspergillus ruber CBS 135680]EYE90736.1 eukaryotic translation initiation factor 3, gamma subunit [Aspergillus ruber CBS 135680]
MHSYIRPYQHVAFRLPSDATRIIHLIPNTEVSLGKYGNFPSNQIIGRPFYLTFEIFDNPTEENGNRLRIITAAELHAESLITEGSGEADGEGDEPDVSGDAETPMRTNREIVDDTSTQKMTLQEIEELKNGSSDAGRDIIAKLLESHSALDQKTAFSLAKYTLRKRRKYMKRFTVLPLDVSLLTNFMIEEKDAARTMELRDELIGLIGCWGNVHHGGNVSIGPKPNGRYLVVDETGGLIVAAMAERMGILYPHDNEDEESEGEPSEKPAEATSSAKERPSQMSASGNTITILHAHTQPNLSLLKYFGYDQDSPDESHPLFTHLKTVSWMQLVDPSSDPIYANEPEMIPDETLATYKANKRGTYYRKRSRWQRVRNVVDEARAGEYDSLLVATLMEPSSVLKHAVPLLAGSAQVAVYSPTIEPLTELIDLYSTPRRTTFINARRELIEATQKQNQENNTDEPVDLSDLEREFIVDPSLLLAPTLETARIRPWQVLPGRTHPMMSGRGGAEGYVFHGIRTFPAQSKIEAAGNPSRKKRKVEANPVPLPEVDVEMKS